MHVAALFSAWGDEEAKAFLNRLKENNVRIASSNGEVKRLEVTLSGVAVTLLNDHILGVDVPADTFCEGGLRIKVTTVSSVSNNRP